MKGLMIPCDGDSRINTPEKYNLNFANLFSWVQVVFCGDSDVTLHDRSKKIEGSRFGFVFNERYDGS